MEHFQIQFPQPSEVIAPNLHAFHSRSGLEQGSDQINMFNRTPLALYTTDDQYVC